ncbi:MAG: hypothetical protein JWR09_649 [Mucilaginibacter sp.]|nr:hypothetical protein [Mucilaginibacter sp.]
MFNVITRLIEMSRIFIPFKTNDPANYDKRFFAIKHACCFN